MWHRDIVALLALVVAVAMRPAVMAAGPDRPAALVTPARDRLSQTSSRAQAVVREIDGKARARVLLDSIAAARKAGDLVRCALELQSLVHSPNGNYLFKLYLVLKDSNAARAREFAELLAQEGIAVGPISGHFEHLEHLDPSAPLSAQPADDRAAQAAMKRWVDAFVSADYDPSYRPDRRGALSELLQLTYADGSKLDIDIRLISDNHDPAPVHAVAHAYVGPGERVFPLRLGRDTTPRLWRAKHEIALAAMYRSNEDYETLVGISLAGVMSNMPLGLVVPVQAPRPSGNAAPRARTATSPRATSPRGQAGSQPATGKWQVPTQARNKIPNPGEQVSRTRRALVCDGRIPKTQAMVFASTKEILPTANVHSRPTTWS